ncbi:NUDIX domain-containing protein [Marinilongibacter aquaticus]|uniref:NUDIX hydrolase n=1 Tax=Marinilongibacter aquaticus TaxID=2975157 RepID=UPI0021BD6F64|nr:NUDIX domain-containing protein [Marinilongibacter aquaticus]UBM57911.1 NUDIX domain-containing protein [Marinilongibacter aquaticus]
MDMGKSEERWLRHVAYDSVIFGFSGEKLKILILEYHNTGLFALPGGLVKTNEDLDEAVKRGLRERTGLENIYLEQFYTFGNARRDPNGDMQTILTQNVSSSFAEEHWRLDRYISIAYYALINYKEVNPAPDELSDSIGWYSVDALPDLMQDHNAIVEKALATLRLNLERKLVGVNLLPERFTMKQLQTVYEAILGEKLRRSTFQRKILSLGILERHEKQFSGAAHKAPFLYSFTRKRN